MNELSSVRSFLSDLITPIVNDAVKAAMPKVESNDRKEYLSVAEVMEQYSLSLSTVYRRFDEGVFTKVKNGGRTLIRRSEVEASLQDRPLCRIEAPRCRKNASK